MIQRPNLEFMNVRYMSFNDLFDATADQTLIDAANCHKRGEYGQAEILAGAADKLLTIPDAAKLLQAITDEDVIASLKETAADDAPVTDEAPFCDGFSLPGYDYLGTRCIISGGEVLELPARRVSDDEPSDEEMPF